MLDTFWKTATTLIAWLIAGAVVGNLVCAILGLAPARGAGSGLSYGIWFALGVFPGFLAFGMAGAWASPAGDETWMDRPGARALGNRVLVSGLLVLAALCGLFYALWWSRGGAAEYFVPQSAPHTIVFFIAAVTAMAFGRQIASKKG